LHSVRDKRQVQALIAQALKEDIYRGDVTTDWIISPKATAKAYFITREQGVIAGLEAAHLSFLQVDPSLQFEASVTDGDRVIAGQSFAIVEGAARAILTGERTALNFIRHLSGIATMTNRYVQAIKGTSAVITDTRKTTPGFRVLEKAAVKSGGGVNHRFGLYDMVLIKDNHIAAAGGITPAVNRCREQMANAERTIKIEVEAAILDQVKEAANLEIDQIMLDNMSDAQMQEAVAYIRHHTEDKKRPLLEASGTITLDRVRSVAETGVDLISIGTLTHSSPCLDISLNIE